MYLGEIMVVAPQILILDPYNSLDEAFAQNELTPAVDFNRCASIDDVGRRIFNHASQLLIINDQELNSASLAARILEFKEKNKKLTVVLITDDPGNDPNITLKIARIASDLWQERAAKCISDFMEGKLTFKTVCAVA